MNTSGSHVEATCAEEKPRPAAKTRLDNIRQPDPWSLIGEVAKVSTNRLALIRGEASDCLRHIPSNSISTCLTSPPYWNARDYGHRSQIGLETDPDDYVARLVDCFRQIHRVLRDDGTVWLNIGDCYINGQGSRPKDWQRNKQLGLLPFRVAIALQAHGWYVRNSMVWNKPNAMPASVRDRLANNWEPVFLLSKSDRYYFNLDAIRVPHKTSDVTEHRRAIKGLSNGKAKAKGELRQWLNSPRHRMNIDGLKEIRRRPDVPDTVELAGYLKAALVRSGLDVAAVAKALNQPFERVRHYFRTDRIGARIPPNETWIQLKNLLEFDNTYDDAMTVVVGDNMFRNHPMGRNPGDVQSFTIRNAKADHFAMMPEELAQWCLQATLPTNGICLDPFMGVGTTGKVALNLGGRFVGIDINSDYFRDATRSLKKCETAILATPPNKVERL